MKTFRYLFIFSLVIALAGISQCPAFAQSVIGNGGFEQPIGSGVESNWDSTNGVVRLSTAEVSALEALPAFNPNPEGGFALNIPSAGNQFTFQLTRNAVPGDYVSFSARAQSSVPAPNGGQLVIEFKDVQDKLISSVGSEPRISNAGAFAKGSGSYGTMTIGGVVPERTHFVVFVLRRDGGVGNVIFDDIHAAVNPAELTLSVSKTTAAPGEAVTAMASFVNQTGDTLSNVSYVVDLPAGLSIFPDKTIVNGQAVAVSSNGIINIGDVAAGQTVTLVSPILVTLGAQPGKDYEIGVKVFNGNNLSGQRRVRIRVENDPLFTEGTIIGKVFHDENKNGVQDKGEPGVPWVRLATEEGVVVITDEHGRYSIPGVKPGRHVVKIDGHTLPEGTEFITEESFLVKTTEGILNKANFAVYLPASTIPAEFQEDLTVRVTQGLDTSESRLEITMDPGALKTGLGVLEKDATFKMNCNYSDFVKRWYIEIRDELGREVWAGFGIDAPPSEVRWNGQMENGLLIKPGIYSYQFKVEDKANRQDWSPLQFFRVVSKNSPNYVEQANIQIPAVGDFNLFEDGKRSIPLVAKPTLRIQGKTRPTHKVRVNQYPVNVDPNTGYFQTEVYTSAGDKEIIVEATSPDGETTSYREVVKVKDSTFFMVALSEGETGLNFSDGNLQSAGDDRGFKNSVYTDGRLSYYLKGKIRGKFLVKSHYDTDDQRSALFKNLDSEDYYPVYGDNSTRDYETQNSLDRFYIIVEMDRSFIRWGSFQTEFNDVELATYNRSLSGLKGHFETLATTPYGDAVRGVTVFWSEAGHRADHNEFLATGGTLYYLRNRRVMEGSDKVRVEVRDKIQNIQVSSRDLVEGIDYEIDYEEGRILLTRPLSPVVSSDTIVSLDILDGNPQYLIVDYEFESDADAYENSDRGLRGFTHLGDHIRIGGTYVEEVRDRERYDLRGIDFTAKVGRNTKIFAEYAESYGGQQTSQSVSYNGGISFDDPVGLRGQNTRPRENAYVIRAESKPVKNLELGGFVQTVEPGFSNERSRSQEGMKKYGVSARYKLSDYAHVKYRFDSAEVVGQLMPLQEHNVIAPYVNNGTHTAQVFYDDGKYMGGLEYQRQKPEFPVNSANLSPSLLSSVQYDNALAAKLGYHINERLLTYVKAQTTMEGKANNQFGGGLRYEVLEGFYGYVEHMIGNIGDSVYMGFEKSEPTGARSYANIRKWTRSIGTEPLVTAIGSSAPLTEKTRIYSERNYSTYNNREGYTADASGLEGRLSEIWNMQYDVRFERRHLDNETTRALDIAAQNSEVQPNTVSVGSAGITISDKEQLKAGLRLEIRRDSDVRKLWQWVARSYIEYKYNEDLTMLSKIDYGKTIDTDTNGVPADFTEFTTGAAYRPIAHDKLNILTRYTYTRDIANDIQFSTPLFTGIETDETAHIFAIDFAYDLFKYMGLVQKLAYKRAIYDNEFDGGSLGLNYFLWANRLNFHVTRKWDLALEYRSLWQWGGSEALRHGALIEIDREFYEYVRLGAGYNFTDFDDDLRKTNSFDSHGPFVRLTGKF